MLHCGLLMRTVPIWLLAIGISLFGASERTAGQDDVEKTKLPAPFDFVQADLTVLERHGLSILEIKYDVVGDSEAPGIGITLKANRSITYATINRHLQSLSRLKFYKTVRGSDVKVSETYVFWPFHIQVDIGGESLQENEAFEIWFYCDDSGAEEFRRKNVSKMRFERGF